MEEIVNIENISEYRALTVCISESSTPLNGIIEWLKQPELLDVKNHEKIKESLSQLDTLTLTPTIGTAEMHQIAADKLQKRILNLHNRRETATEKQLPYVEDELKMLLDIQKGYDNYIIESNMRFQAIKTTTASYYSYNTNIVQPREEYATQREINKLNKLNNFLFRLLDYIGFPKKRIMKLFLADSINGIDRKEYVDRPMAIAEAEQRHPNMEFHATYENEVDWSKHTPKKVA